MIFHLVSAIRTAYNPFSVKPVTPKQHKPSPLLPRSISREFKTEPETDGYDEPDGVVVKPRKRLATKTLHKSGGSKVLRHRIKEEDIVDDTPQIEETDSMDVGEDISMNDLEPASIQGHCTITEM